MVLTVIGVDGIRGGAAETSGGVERARARLETNHRQPEREFETDRPDKTESAYSVEPGIWQVEADILSKTRDHATSKGPEGLDEVREGIAAGVLNIKRGLTSKIDAQVIVETYREERVENRKTGQKIRAGGVGDTTLRLKVNVWGNDGGATAFAVMPFVTLPTAQRGLGAGRVEAGVALPLAVELPGGFGLGLMSEVDFVGEDDRSGLRPSWIHSVTFGRDLTKRLGAYVEFFSEVPSGRAAEWIGTVDGGLVFSVTENFKLDAGVNIGVTAAAEDWNPFLGFSVRF